MEKINSNEVFWHSRRGMLELDLLLVPFVKTQFDFLSPEDQLLYIDFLKQEDQDLFAWLIRREIPGEPRFNLIIDKILAHQQSTA
jgi:antitoxin CptB